MAFQTEQAPKSGILTSMETNVNKSLYHGSKTWGLKELRESDYGTIGSGVYLTDRLELAQKYTEQPTAWLRKQEPGPIYVCTITDAKFIDLKPAYYNPRPVVAEVKQRLIEIANDPSTPKEMVDAAKSITRDFKFGGDALFGITDTPFMRSLRFFGYDGIIAGDMYLLFKPNRITSMVGHDVKALLRDSEPPAEARPA